MWNENTAVLISPSHSRPPRDLDSKAFVTIGDQVRLSVCTSQTCCSTFFAELNTYINVTSASSVQNFVVKADDLEQIAELGRGAYGVVDKMKHVPSGVIMAVKVGLGVCCAGYLI